MLLYTVVAALLPAACGDAPPETGPGQAPPSADRAAPPVASPSQAPLWKANGARFESAPLNFRIEAPAGWAWSEDASHQVRDQNHFIARRDAKTFFRITVRDRNLFENTEKSVVNFLQGLEAAIVRSGFVVSEMHHAPRSTPAGIGYAYAYTSTRPQGSKARADGFVLAADRLYMIQYTSLDRAELAAFQRFLDSLQLLAPVR